MTTTGSFTLFGIAALVSLLWFRRKPRAEDIRLRLRRDECDPVLGATPEVASWERIGPGRVDTGSMTAATKIERSGPAIRAVLAELAPAECEEFEAEFHQALARANTDFDLGHVDAVLDRWWGVAAMCANPLTGRERELIVQARAGVDTGWYAREDDRWVQL